MSGAPSQATVAVVSYDTCELLRDCLTSIEEAEPAEVIVADNGSTDGSAEVVRAEFPRARLIVGRNVGYGAAANGAVAAATTPFVLLLNADTRLRPGALSILVDYAERRPEVAVVGPRLVNPDGTLQRSTYPFPSAVDIVVGESGLHLLLRRLPGLRARFLRTWSHDRPLAVPWVLGAALLLRRSAFDAVGGFDERFFMYGEEVDLCRRLLDVGFETHFCPEAVVVHHGGASTRREPAAMQRELVVSTRRLLEQHSSPGARRRLLLVLRAVLALRLARELGRLAVAGSTRRREVRDAAAALRALVADRKLWRS